MRFFVRLTVCASLLLLVNAKIMEIHKSDGRVERYYVSDVTRLTVEQGSSMAARPAPALQSRIADGLRVLGSGVLQVSVATRSRVRIELFDARGRLVAGVHDKVREPGSHRFHLDRIGAGAGTGWYVVRATIGGRVLSRTLVLCR
ncbi:MAG: hypothetical protein GF331_18010 [Chitinivibrionales bacterium]|nr:hypothetical protein [Chitinivibrionales bacterium]